MDQPIADTPAGGRTAPQRDSLSLRTERRIRDVLDGRAVGRGRFLLFTGPAVMASIAYMDPGNFATNIQAGAKYGYGLLWVVLAANLVAMLFQALSASSASSPAATSPSSAATSSRGRCGSRCGR